MVSSSTNSISSSAVTDEFDPSATLDADTRQKASDKALAGLSKFSRRITRGTVIFEQDDPGETMYFVREGRIRISKVVGDKVQPIAIIEKGDFFGEMALLSRESRTARAEVLEDCTVVELDQNTFYEFLRSNHEAAIRMLLTLVKRLRQTDELIETMMFDDPQWKVSSTLLKLIKGVRKESQGYPVPMDVHALMIASGTDTRLLRMVLKRFRDAGFVEVMEKAIYVRDRSRLQQYNNFLKMKGSYLEPAAAPSRR